MTVITQSASDARIQAAALRLAHARSTESFVNIAHDIVEAGDHTEIVPDRLLAIGKMVANGEPVSWAWLLPDPDTHLHAAALEFALFAAPNGGYFDTAPDGSIRQWAEAGSGARALSSWITRLRAAGKLPGVHITDPAVARAELKPELADLPYPDARLAIAMQFAERQRLDALTELVQATRSHTGQHIFRLDHADRLARIFPAAFGDDPFRKKAILFFLFLHGHLHHKGHPAVFDLPIPSDYQMPRILHYLGAIRISDTLRTMLTASNRLLDVTSAPVIEYRAAAIVCADLLRAATGQPTSVIDSALFIPLRKDPAFQANSLPAMRCDTMWF